MRQLERHLALWQTPQEPLKIFGQLVIGWMGYQFIEIRRDGANILSDAPLIVVEYTDEPARRVAYIVERLKRDPVGQRRVTKDGHNVFIAATLIPRRADPQRC